MRLGLLLAVSVFATACTTATKPPVSGGDTTNTPAASSSAASASSTATSVPPVAELLDFEAPLLDGGTFRGADLAGKDVAFWFWAPW